MRQGEIGNIEDTVNNSQAKSYEGIDASQDNPVRDLLYEYFDGSPSSRQEGAPCLGSYTFLPKPV